MKDNISKGAILVVTVYVSLFVGSTNAKSRRVTAGEETPEFSAVAVNDEAFT